MTLDEQIESAIADTMKALGYGIVRLRVLTNKGIMGATKILDILIERLDGEHVGIDDCKTASQNISAILDVEEIIVQRYNLEVSSAGVERPLVRLEDFTRFTGRDAQIKTHKAVGETKKFEGRLLGVEGEIVKIETTKPKAIVEIEFENIKDARLVLTNEMFKQIMKSRPETE